MKFIDIVGQRFSKLFVMRRGENNKDGKGRFWCICDCGNKILTTGVALRRGTVKSCRSGICAANFKHGHAKDLNISKTYRAWRSMLNRCENPTDKSYHRYGGRGISVCAEWHTFTNFLADMGEAPKARSLDRINNDGNYEPLNCRWVTISESAINRSTTKLYTFLGQTCCISEWAKRVGIREATLSARLRIGWPIERALLEFIRVYPN